MCIALNNCGLAKELAWASEAFGGFIHTYVCNAYMIFVLTIVFDGKSMDLVHY